MWPILRNIKKNILIEMGTFYKVWFSQTSRFKLELYLRSKKTITFPEKQNPKVSIVIILYNQAHFTLKCLLHLHASNFKNFEIIIIDNCSKDKTTLLLNRICGVIVYKNKNNIGFTLAANQGARVARGEYILFLNNDAFLEPQTIENALKVFEQEDRVGAVGGKVLQVSGKIQEAGCLVESDGSSKGIGRNSSSHVGRFNFRKNVDFISGVFLLTPKQIFQDIRGFDNDYAPAYYEDVDYCFKLHQQKFKVIYEPTSVLRHYEYGSSKGSLQARKLIQNNQSIFVKKHKENIGKARDTQTKILVIDDSIPFRIKGRGLPRTREVLNGLADLNLQVVFFPTRTAKSDFVSWEKIYQVCHKNIEIVHERDKNLGRYLDLNEKDFKWIWVSRPHNKKLFDVWKKNKKINAKIIYDAESIFSLRQFRYKQVIKNKMFKLDTYTKFKKEIELARDSHEIVTVSSAEKKWFQSQSKSVHVLGHRVKIHNNTPTFDQRKNFLFVGSLEGGITPNIDSLLWFHDQVIPVLEKKLEEDFHVLIVGTYKKALISRFNNKKMKFLGSVENTDPFYNESRVFIAPTRFSAGIPLKICEAAGMGIPIIATQLLCDQLQWTADKDLAVAITNDPISFAEKCEQVYRNPQIWSELQKNALIRTLREYSDPVFKTQLSNIVSKWDLDS